MCRFLALCPPLGELALRSSAERLPFVVCLSSLCELGELP